jgi:hypothetical protein
VFATVRPVEDFNAVQTLVAGGLSDYEVARRTGIPRATVQNWRRRPLRLRKPLPPAPGDWQPPDPWAYAYLLGLYLGDGHIAVSDKGSAAVLRLYMDERYGLIIAAAANVIRRTVPGPAVRVHPRPGSVAVCASSRVWPVAFPQHGPGRKHERPIRLTGWQVQLTTRHPKALLRGLIHSDGCRTVNRFTVALPESGRREYAYPRYFFSNHSIDIQRIFCHHCELLGIKWTQSKPYMLSVSDRTSVSLLDSFVGPKE